MQPKPGSADKKATRQCWECHKRRLVCDHTLPHCKKCQKAGKECPGYDEQKPLQWIEPGKVTSKRRKKDSPPKVYVVTCTARNETSSQKPQDCVLSSPALPVGRVIKEKSEIRHNHAAWESLDEGIWCNYPARTPEERKLGEGMLKSAKIVEQIGKMSKQVGRKQIERVVRYGLREEASEIMRNENNPLEKLENMLCHMYINDLPVYDYLTNETSDIVQAVNYFNIRILPEYYSGGELAPNPAIMIIPLQALYLLPPAIHHVFACLALNYFVLTAPGDVDQAMVAKNHSKVFRHRGHAIRALSEDIARDKTRCSDMTIVSILMFMSMELSNPTSTDWRVHASGLQRIIHMRGGLKTLMQSGPHLTPSLVIYILIVTYANACSPPWDQLTANSDDSIETYISDITPIYSLIFPYNLCPPTLYFDLIRINHLRNSASASLLLGTENPSNSLEARDILARIEAFAPEDWAQAGTRYDEWVLIGTIYQSTLAIYCTMALQSPGILPNNLEMDIMRSVHGDRLRTSLATALKMKCLSRFMMWPLVVAGVEAGYRSEGVRDWIAQRLLVLSHELGTSSPLKAREVLAKYWKKGQPNWDACFEQAYGFVI